MLLSKPLPDWLEARVAELAAELDLRVKVMSSHVSVCLSVCLSHFYCLSVSESLYICAFVLLCQFFFYLAVLASTEPERGRMS